MASKNPAYGEMVQCPYNKSHIIRAERMQVHLMKCEKQHPHVKLRKCPYNYTHHIKAEQYKEHLENCPDRYLLPDFDFEQAKDHFKPALDSQTPSTSGVNAKQALRAVTDNNDEPMAAALDEENWDDMNEPPYNPLKYCMENKIIRKPRMLTKKERIKFYEEEKIRHAKLAEKQSKKEDADENNSP